MTLPTRFDGTRLRRRVARAVTATTVTAMTLAAALLGAAPASAEASAALSHTVYVSSSTSPALRDCYHPSKQPFPNTNCTLRFYLTPGSAVTLICQYPGQQVGNDSYWDYVQTGNGYGYVTDWYINNPSAPSAPYRDTSVPICNY